MKIIDILNREPALRFTKWFIAAKSVKQLLAVSIGALVGIGAQSVNAQGTPVYSVNIVGCVPDMTTYLLTAPLTTAQRQALHAQNFNQLPPSARALYLHAVAFDVAFAVPSGGKLPTSAMLAQHLQSVASICEAPAIPPEYAPIGDNGHKLAVDQALQELNVGIAGPIANNTSFHQAMYAGAIYGFMWWDWWD